MTKVYVMRVDNVIQFLDYVNQPNMQLEAIDADDAEVVSFLNPPAAEPVTIVYQVDLWSRMTDEEAEEVMTVMATQPIRIQNIFRSANAYHSDHELWALLETVATNLFGAERAAEILAASV